MRLLYKRGRGTENSEHSEGAFCAVYSKRAQREQVLWLLFSNVLDAQQSLFTCTITPNISCFFLDELLLIFAVPYFNTLSPFIYGFTSFMLFMGREKCPLMLHHWQIWLHRLRMRESEKSEMNIKGAKQEKEESHCQWRKDHSGWNHFRYLSHSSETSQTWMKGGGVKWLRGTAASHVPVEDVRKLLMLKCRGRKGWNCEMVALSVLLLTLGGRLLYQRQGWI